MQEFQCLNVNRTQRVCETAMAQDELTHGPNKWADAQACSRSVGTEYDLHDVPDQIRWLAARARILGYTSIDELLWKNPVQFELLAERWRNLISGLACSNYGKVLRTKAHRQ